MRRRLLGLVAASLVLAAASCSDASKPAASNTSLSSQSRGDASAAAPAADPRANAQAALDAYWTMVKRLSAAPDPNDPEIDHLAVDPSASSIRDLLTTRKAEGQIAQYDGVPYSVVTTVSSATATEASFGGCIVDGARVVVLETGQVVDDKVTTSRISGSMVFVGGAWKVQRFDVLRKADGEVSCDSLS